MACPSREIVSGMQSVCFTNLLIRKMHIALTKTPKVIVKWRCIFAKTGPPDSMANAIMPRSLSLERGGINVQRPSVSSMVGCRWPKYNWSHNSNISSDENIVLHLGDASWV